MRLPFSLLHIQERYIKHMFLICLALVSLLFLPFINKPFHLDDYAFLQLAKMIDWNPLVVFPADLAFRGKIVHQFLPYESSHPLLIPYLLKVLIHFFGENEIPLHGIFLAFPILFLISIARIDHILFGAEEKRTSIILVLFASIPALAVNGQNLMTDVPALALTLAAIADYAAFAEGEPRRYVLSGTFWFCCACFTSYQMLLMIPVTGVFILFAEDDKKRRITAIIGLSSVILIMFIWLGLVWWNYDLIPLLKSSSKINIQSEILRGLQLKIMAGKILFILAMTGTSVILLKFLFWEKNDWRYLYQTAFFTICSGLLLVIYPPDTAPEGAFNIMFLAVLCGIGASAYLQAFHWIMTKVRTPKTRGLGIFFAGWLIVTLACALFVLPFGSARYLLPALPALLLILAHKSSFSPSLPRQIIVTIICIITSILFSWSDYQYAQTYRNMGNEVSFFRKQLSSTATVWYIGEWGARIYMERGGARYLLADSMEPTSGDYIIIPEMCGFWKPSAKLRPRLQKYAERVFISSIPLRLFNLRSSAGFYCHGWGLLPFSISSAPDEIFSIYRVN